MSDAPAVEFLLAFKGGVVGQRVAFGHFSVDDNPIDAWASMKSFRRKDGGDDPPAGRLGRNARREAASCNVVRLPKLDGACA